jgi:hypothetical protein
MFTFTFAFTFAFAFVLTPARPELVFVLALVMELSTSALIREMMVRREEGTANRVRGRGIADSVDVDIVVDEDV